MYVASRFLQVCIISFHHRLYFPDNRARRKYRKIMVIPQMLHFFADNVYSFLSGFLLFSQAQISTNYHPFFGHSAEWIQRFDLNANFASFLILFWKFVKLLDHLSLFLLTATEGFLLDILYINVQCCDTLKLKFKG